MDISEQFQQAMQSAANSAPVKAATDWWKELNSFTEAADGEAERRFPGQARDSSQKNAFRHALGAGRLAQMLGANSGIPGVETLAQGVAKMAGYGWEGMGGMKNFRSADMRHDLNANAIGISQAAKTADFRALAESLASYAQSARKEAPPSVFQPALQHFTYTK